MRIAECHGVAVVPPRFVYPPDYKKPISFFTDPKYFTKTNTQTDFSWALPSAN